MNETELTTIADDAAVAFRGTEVIRWDGLAPATDYDYEGLSFRTLPRPPGERLATIATVNDVHFGEIECGRMDGGDGSWSAGPVLRADPGAEPYPEVMNRAAVAEMAAIDPDAVVVKGDLTDDGRPEEYEAFLACYRPAFGDRLHHVRGNHDAYRHQRFADHAPFAVHLPGVVLAVVDTVVPGSSGGAFDADQAAWLEDVAAAADRPVLVLGHHHVWAPTSRTRPAAYFGVNPTDSERLVGVVERRHRIVAYLAGHTHRNRVRRFPATGLVPWVEVACVKDFPGVWAEYRVFEGGILQVVHRISDPAALAWTERTRAMFGGLYPQYAFGTVDDRCFPIWPRSQARTTRATRPSTAPNIRSENADA